MIRQIVERDIPALFVVRPQTRENAMSVPELACIGITRDSMANAIKGSHRGWLFEEAGEVCGFAMGNVAKALGSIAKASRKLAEARGLPEDLAHNGH